MVNIIDLKKLSKTELLNNGGIFHIKNFYSEDDIEVISKDLQLMEYVPLYHENRITRYECDYKYPIDLINSFKNSITSIANIDSVRIFL